MLKIKNLLVSQQKPEGTKSPYFDIAEKYNINIKFRPFIKVEEMPLAEFLKQKIDISQYTAIVFMARVGIDNFFRMANESKTKIVPELKYFCLNESFAFYIQKYVKYRKRKVFGAQSGKLEDLFALLEKNKNEKFLFVLPDNPTKEIDALLKKSKLNYSKGLMYRSVTNEFKKSEKLDYDMFLFFSPNGVGSLMKSFPDFEQGERYIGCLGTATAKAIKGKIFLDKYFLLQYNRPPSYWITELAQVKQGNGLYLFLISGKGLSADRKMEINKGSVYANYQPTRA